MFQNAPPIVISVVRATEILLALLVEKLIFNTKETSILHSIGAVTVLIGVSLMAASEYLQEKIDVLCNKRKSALIT